MDHTDKKYNEDLQSSLLTYEIDHRKEKLQYYYLLHDQEALAMCNQVLPLQTLASLEV